MTSTAPPLTRLGTRPKPLPYIRSLWARREFAVAIPEAQLRARNRNTVLGNLWHLLDPLLMVGIYYLVFGVILDVSRGVDNFVGFLAIGVFVFHFTSKSVRAGAKSLTTNEGLVRSISFPRAILPLSVVLSELASLLFAFVAMYGVVLLTGEEPGWTWLLLAPIVALQLLFNVGLALFMARVTSHFRDVLQVLPYTLRVWGYLSGVFYDPVVRLSDRHPVLLSVLELNPAYLFMHLARQAILQNSAGTLRQWGLLAAWSVVTLVAGFFFFLRREHEYGRA